MAAAAKRNRVSGNQLREVIRGMLREVILEVISEATPSVSYLSKAKGPAPSTAWDPESARQWDAQNPGVARPPKPPKKKNPEEEGLLSPEEYLGLMPTVAGDRQPPPNQPAAGAVGPGVPMPSNLDKTIPGGIAARAKAKFGGGRPVPPTGTSTVTNQPQQQASSQQQPSGASSSMADMSTMLQGASQEQIAKIMAILKGS